jgi:intracellular sulfur oxidation DsrE/DsrF family protein
MVCPGALASERYGKQKVVYHINYDDSKLQKGALRNIQNHINAVGAENIEVRVVLHGNGLSLLLNPESLSHLTKFKYANATEEMAARIDGLKSQGVSFKICNNTIKGRKVDMVDDLYDADSDYRCSAHLFTSNINRHLSISHPWSVGILSHIPA